MGSNGEEGGPQLWWRIVDAVDAGIKIARLAHRRIVFEPTNFLSQLLHFACTSRNSASLLPIHRNGMERRGRHSKAVMKTPIRSAKADASAPQSNMRALFGRRLSAGSLAAGTAAATIAIGWLARRALPHEVNDSRESTQAALHVFRQADTAVMVRYEDHGDARVAYLDGKLYDDEAQRQVAVLSEARQSLQLRAAATLRSKLGEALADMHGPDRVNAFASWYYAYATSYELLRIGALAAATSLPSPTSAREAATAAVSQAVLDKYLVLVLRPATLEPALRRSFEHAAREARRDFGATVEQVHAEALPLLREHTTHLPNGSPAAATPMAQLQVDWRFARLAAADVPLAHERTAAGLASMMIVTAGAVAGKAAGGAAGQAAAAAAAKALAGKLSAPFAAKAVSAAGSALAAGTAAAASGPAGAAVGVGVGLAIDYGVAKGERTSLAPRPPSAPPASAP